MTQFDADGFIIPDARYVQEAEQEDVSHRPVGLSPKFIKVPPPDGFDDWADTHVGARHGLWIWLCPAYAADKPLGYRLQSHFVRPKKKRGTRVVCAGENCLFCDAFARYRYKTPPDLKAIVRMCAFRVEHVYNALNLNDPSDHTIGDGAGGQVWRPALLSCTKKANGDVVRLLARQGVEITMPRVGTPLYLERARTGPEEFNLETSLTPGRQEPLREDFWPLCRPDLLWDLEAQYAEPSEAEQRVVFDSLPWPNKRANATSTSRAPGPQLRAQSMASQPMTSTPPQQPPQHQNYQRPPAQGFYTPPPQPAASQPRAFQGQVPPQAYSPSQTQAASYDDDEPPPYEPPEWNAAQEFGEPPPAKYPSQPSSQAAPARPPQAPAYTAPNYTQQASSGPPAQPPAVTQGAPRQPPPAPAYTPPAGPPAQQPAATQGPPPAPHYGKQPASGSGTHPPPPPPPPHYAPQAPQAQGRPAAPPSYGPPPGQQQAAKPPGHQQAAAKRLVAPLGPDVTLPDHRERCFTQYDPQAQMCLSCPPYIKSQCMPQTPGFVPENTDAAALDSMLAQMAGPPQHGA